MNQSFKKYFRNWINDTNERAKLQHAYLAITIAVVLASGIISLFDAPVGRTFVGVAVGALLIFVINAVMWALLHSVTTRLSPPTKPVKATRKK
jgi:hypothetical protein